MPNRGIRLRAECPGHGGAGILPAAFLQSGIIPSTAKQGQGQVCCNPPALPPDSTRNGAGDLVFTFGRKTASVGGVNLALQWASDFTFPPLNSVPIGARSSSFDGITAVEDAIRSIEAATTQPELRSIKR